jgi:hypothetical protein
MLCAINGLCRLCYRLRALSYTACFGLHGHLQVCSIEPLNNTVQQDAKILYSVQLYNSELRYDG